MPGVSANRHIHGLLADMGVDRSSTALAPSSPLSNGEAKGVKKAEKKKNKDVGESGDVATVINGSEGKTVAKGLKRKKETGGEGTPGKAEKNVLTNGDATPDAKQKKKKEKKGKEEEAVEGEKKTKKKKAKREESSDGEKESGGGSGEEEISDAEENPMALKNFGISENVKRALEAKGIKALFPIQAQTFNIVMDGSDLVARARTGQGKTLAFVLPILERLLAETNGESQKAYGRPPRVIVLAPTRELAKQVGADFEVLGESVRLSTVCVYGGAPMGPQESKLRRGVDVVVGTPGRVKDLLQRNTLSLKSLRFRVLDEADEMLNMGFVDDVETILGAVADASTVQTLLFSATIPAWVNEISKRFLKPHKKTVDLVGDEKLKASASVRHLMLPCHWTQRCQVVTDLISCYSRGGRVIVFTETKNDATALAEGLAHAGARALHGDIPQNQREATLAGFRAGTFKVLVATDVAARGLDINDVQLVVQCSPPQTEETYIHRSGRTGRAGATGISVMLTGGKKDYMIDIIQRKAGVKFERIAVPQPADIARSSASNAADSVREVGNSVIPLFREAAEQLMEQSDVPPADLLAKALARIAGHSELKRRSLLTAHDDATTLLFRASTSIRTPTYVFSMLRRLLPEDVVNSVRRMSLTADCSGAVFDVPSAAAQQFVDAFANEGNAEDGHATVTLEIAEKLPELQAKPETRGSPGGSRFGSGGFSRGRGGSSPGGFGGRGSRSPGHGGRGGGRGRGGGGRGRR